MESIRHASVTRVFIYCLLKLLVSFQTKKATEHLAMKPQQCAVNRD